MAFGISASTLLTVGAGIAGGAIAAKGSRDAANTQAGAARDATDLQREQFNRQVELNEPFRQGGVKANNRMLYLLGLDPGAGGQQMETRDQIRARLAPQYQGGTRGTSGTAATGGGRYFLENEGAGNNQGEYAGTPATFGDVGSPGFRSDGDLGAAIDAEVARQQGLSDSAMQKAMTDPEYGSLMRDFGMSDFQKDPGYEFRMNEGIRSQQRGAAASGLLGSGKYMKDLMRFGQDLGSQEYGRAYDRFQINRANKLNPLQSLAGVGQSVAGRMGDAGMSFANNAGNTIMQGANARASGYVGGANAINNAIGQGFNMYQNNRMMNLMERPRSGGVIGPGYGGSRFTVPTYEDPEY